jgi:hypothetical protein
MDLEERLSNEHQIRGLIPTLLPAQRANLVAPLLEDLSPEDRLEVLHTLPWCLKCGWDLDPVRGVCYCTRDE